MAIHNEKEAAISTLWDVYKDGWGVRPRAVYAWDEMSVEDIWEEVERLGAMEDEEDDDPDYWAWSGYACSAHVRAWEDVTYAARTMANLAIAAHTACLA